MGGVGGERRKGGVRLLHISSDVLRFSACEGIDSALGTRLFSGLFAWWCERRRGWRYLRGESKSVFGVRGFIHST